MKKLFLFLAVFPFMQPLRAQGIFNQDAEMMKQTIRQLVLLATYGGYIKKGYEIMEGGLYTIHDLKNGELNLHTTYIRSLGKVNPKIKGKQVENIRRLANDLLKGCTGLKKEALQSGMFKEDEIAYLQSTLQGYLIETARDLEELNLIVSDDSLSMTDDERMEQINRLQDQITMTFQKFSTMSQDTRTIIAGRTELKRHHRELRLWLWGIRGQIHE